jgi:hypothetical protein
MSPSSGQQVEIVVFNAEPQPEQHAEACRIPARYRSLVDSGRMTLLTNPGGHPQLAVRGSEPLEHESERHWAWRRKLALDFAHVAAHSSQRGDYYLHVEDDMLAARDFLPDLTSWFDEYFANRDDWAFLSLFVPLRLVDREEIPLDQYYSCCALLFRCDDLAPLVGFLRRRFDEAPLDFLVREFAATQGKAVFARVPSLFQHVGVLSTGDDETNPVQALAFRESSLAAAPRGLREAIEVLVHGRASLPTFLRWRADVLAPALVPPGRFVMRVVRRLARKAATSAR